jgi:hypothetical protein
MNVFALRLRDGGCLIVLAEDESAARNRAQSLCSVEEIASVRPVSSFAARFSLTDDGDLVSTLLDPVCLADLIAHEYPMLNAARAQSFDDFGASQTDSQTEPVLYDREAREHKADWEGRDKSLISFAVRQERQRLAS